MFVQPKSSLLIICSILALLALPAHAQNAPFTSKLFNKDSRPLDINGVPILNSLVKNGARLFYMGERSGLYGWFIVKDGQVQMIYVTPDGQTAIIGGMFTGDGDNVTGPQIQALADTNKEIGNLVNSTARQQDEVTKAGSVPGGYAAIPGGAPANAGNLAGNKLPAVPLSPGERLMQDLQAAAGVTLGKNDNAELLIVIGPNCPHCKAVWKELRKPVQDGLVQVRLIPAINRVNGDDISKSEDVRVGAQLLKAANPFDAWDKYVSGDKGALAGEADSVRTQAVISNAMLLEKWNIHSTPYMVYRAKDGRVKIVQGEPQRMAAVLADLLK